MYFFSLPSTIGKWQENTENIKTKEKKNLKILRLCPKLLFMYILHFKIAIQFLSFFFFFDIISWKINTLMIARSFSPNKIPNRNEKTSSSIHRFSFFALLQFWKVTTIKIDNVPGVSYLRFFEFLFFFHFFFFYEINALKTTRCKIIKKEKTRINFFFRISHRCRSLNHFYVFINSFFLFFSIFFFFLTILKRLERCAVRY